MLNEFTIVREEVDGLRGPNTSAKKSSASTFTNLSSRLGLLRSPPSPSSCLSDFESMCRGACSSSASPCSLSSHAGVRSV